MDKKNDVRSLKVIVIGDTYLDLVSEQKGNTLGSSDTFVKTFGGEGFLTSLAMARHGSQVTLSSPIGNDAFGKGIRSYLAKEGILTLDYHLKTPLRFQTFDKEETAIFNDESNVSIPCDLANLTIFFISYLLTNNLLKEALLKIQDRKNRGESIVFIIEKSIDDIEPFLELISLADLTISFGLRTPTFLSELDSALKKNRASFVIERHPGVFDILHRNEHGSLLLEKTSTDLIASYSLGWYLGKTLEETKNMVFIPSQKSLKEIEQIHSNMIAKDFQCLCFLTFDQTTYFEEIARTRRRDEEEMSKFKELIYNAFVKSLALEHTATLGICVDNAHGKDILAKSLPYPFALIRSIDAETKKECIEDPYSLVRSWPKKEIIKVLFTLKDGEMPSDDVRFLKNFYEAIKESGHRLLIEIYDKEIPGREERALATISKLYELGIRPALWMLQPSFDLEAWSHIENVLEKFDPSAGILILGDRYTVKHLAKELKELKEKMHKIRGFAIGRSIWQTVAEHWFEKRISDEMVESEVAFNFRRLLRIWENPSLYHADEFEDRALEHLKR